MDLRLTNTELEIKHGTKEDIIEVVDAIERLICFKVNLPYPLAHTNTGNPVESLLDTTVEDLIASPTTNTSEEDKLVEDILEVLNQPVVEVKKKLVFAKCPECGETFCTMTAIEGDLAPTLHCRCGEDFIAHDLMRGGYECECGQKGFFLMTPQVDSVRCKTCKKDIFMMYNQEDNRYEGYKEPVELY